MGAWKACEKEKLNHHGPSWQRHVKPKLEIVQVQLDVFALIPASNTISRAKNMKAKDLGRAVESW